MKNATSRIVFKTAVYTLFVTVITFSYGTAVLGLLFPQTMADFCDVIGSYNAAAMYYERIYNNNKTSENLYMMLDRYIIAENYGKVAQYGGSFLAHPDSYEVINKVNLNGKFSANSKEEFIRLCNEENRIQYIYIFALLKQNKEEIAKNVLLDKLNEIGKGDIDFEHPIHSYMAFVAAGINDSLLQDEFITYFIRFVETYNLLRPNDSYSQIMSLDFILTFGGFFINQELYISGETFDKAVWDGYYAEFQSIQFSPLVI